MRRAWLTIQVEWNGHATAHGYFHYHHPAVPIASAYGGSYPSSDTLVGFALDGFPIYGALDDASVLDDCNGRFSVQGDLSTYQYHLRTLEQVDGDGESCSTTTVGALAWNYMIGCYHGDITRTVIAADDGDRSGITCTSTQYIPLSSNTVTLSIALNQVHHSSAHV